MSYTDKLRRKAEKERLVGEVLKEMQHHPEWTKFRKEIEQESVEKALKTFMLITCDYLFRNFGCKERGLKKFCDFAARSINYTQDDVMYFRLMNEELKADTGFDVKGYLDEHTEREE